MLIECPSCATAYELPDGSIAASGRKVRCAACKTMWLVEPPAPVAPQPETSIEERFAADDLRLAGLDGDSAAADAEPEPAARPDVPARLNLRQEATLADDPAIGADQEPDNSQDDVDALFATPSAAEFGGDLIEAEEKATDEPADEPPATAENEAIVDAAPGLAGAARKARARMGNIKKAPRPRIPLAAAASIALLFGLGLTVLYRTPVVAAVPQTARLFAAIGLPVNLRGVEIRNVVSKLVTEQGQTQLVVEGEIVNVTKAEAKLSRLRFAVRSEKGQEIYSWKAAVDKPALQPNETLKFRRRLATPPEGASDVLVRFETRGDMIAGVQ